MIDHLKTIENPLIIETGCARPPDLVPWGTIDISFKDDGMSTLIFDQFINDFGGDFHSVDLTQRHVDFARSQVSDKSQIHCDDSVGFLWHVNKILAEDNRYVDLLYLDSYDFEASDPYPSMVHHIKEIAVILGRLRPGSMIAVDDNVGTGTERMGKPKYVAEMMEAMGVPLFYEGLQLIWKL
jgi:hypothetical protein